MSVPEYVIDAARTACLCDVGLPDHRASVAVSDDGTEHLVIIEDGSVGDRSVRYDATCHRVAHEQLGALPPRWRDRTWLAPLRCGQPTKNGRPCRALVGRPGGACAWHRQKAPA